MVILVTMETVIYFGSKYKTVWNIGNFSNSRNIDHLATLTQVWHRGLGGQELVQMWQPVIVQQYMQIMWWTVGCLNSLSANAANSCGPCYTRGHLYFLINYLTFERERPVPSVQLQPVLVPHLEGKWGK